jgi:hypothetical protein
MESKELIVVRFDFDESQWVTAGSVHGYLNVKIPLDTWMRRTVAKFKFRSGADWFRKPQFLFSPVAAEKVISNSPVLDEYGLPILPSEKRRGPLINPYRF